MLNNILELWKTGEFTEDQIVAALSCTHLDFRQTLMEQGIRLPVAGPGAHAEIRMEYTAGADLNYDSEDWIAKHYGVSKQAALHMMRTPPGYLDKEQYTDGDIRRYLEAGNDVVSAVKKFGCTLALARRLSNHKRVLITGPVKALIAEHLAGGMQQKEVAALLGISESAVSKANPNKIAKPRGNIPDDREWEDLKASMTRYSISELSRMYCVSRAYIYNRLKKEDA